VGYGTGVLYSDAFADRASSVVLLALLSFLVGSLDIFSTFRFFFVTEHLEDDESWSLSTIVE
jgi:hypothetical protein